MASCHSSSQSVWGWRQSIFMPSLLIRKHMSMGSLNINTDSKSIQYMWSVPTHRLRLWVFPYVVLFLLTSWSSLKFMSSLHTQAQGVTHTENRMDLIVMIGCGNQLPGLRGFCLILLFIPFFLPAPT